MVKKPKRPTRAAEIKEQLEQIVGHKIDASEQQLAKFAYPVGLSSYWSGSATWKTIFPPNKICSQQQVIDVSGVLSTLADGKRVFLLSDVVCPPLRIGYVEPVNVVATPRAERPVFLTMTYLTVVQGGPPPRIPVHHDVQITVFTWEANGAPAANVEFDWRCRAVWIGESGPWPPLTPERAL
jgi:hypothetical protein